jgi:hypothetical protein
MMAEPKAESLSYTTYPMTRDEFERLRKLGSEFLGSTVTSSGSSSGTKADGSETSFSGTLHLADGRVCHFDGVLKQIKIYSSEQERVQLRELRLSRLSVEQRWVLANLAPEYAERVAESDDWQRKALSVAYRRQVLMGYWRVCSRCGGSGFYSYCEKWGTTCFQCGYLPGAPGTGVHPRNLTSKMKKEILARLSSGQSLPDPKTPLTMKREDLQEQFKAEREAKKAVIKKRLVARASALREIIRANREKLKSVQWMYDNRPLVSSLNYLVECWEKGQANEGFAKFADEKLKELGLALPPMPKKKELVQ